MLTTFHELMSPRVASIGSQGYIMNSQEPDGDAVLPVDDAAWVSGQPILIFLRLTSNLG
jgi:hypothetical protein